MYVCTHILTYKYSYTRFPYARILKYSYTHILIHSQKHMLIFIYMVLYLPFVSHMPSYQVRLIQSLYEGDEISDKMTLMS